MKLSGEGQAQLIRIAALLAAGVLAAWIVKRQLGTLTSAAGDYVDHVLTAAGDAITGAVDSVKVVAVDAYDAAVTPRAGTDGWQFFPMDGIAIDPAGAYWRGTKKIWSPQ